MPAFDKTWQRLFKEIVIWRRLSHPGILPALGVSPRLFPTYVIIEWMINGNIMEFTLVLLSKYIFYIYIVLYLTLVGANKLEER